LRQRPFPATPDGTCYYPATSHERALARLLRGLADGEGLLLLTGAPGTGKTLLCHCLLERLGAGARSAFLTNSHLPDRAGLLQAILYDLSLPYQGQREQEMRLALMDYLLRGYEEGPTVLLVDEAHLLSPDLLEELRLLGNLEARGGKALQVLLVGQPGLLDTLDRPELASLRQRIAVRASVEPLALQEAADYLLHHVRVAGGRPEEFFAEEALELLAGATHGVPRLLNQVAHEAMTLAAEAEADQIDAEAVLEALAAFGLEVNPGGGPDGGLSPEDEPLLVIDEAGVAEEGEASEVGEEGTAEPSCRLFPESQPA
jgi:type II secretory pathway predicted ATPase ExeA